MSEKEENTGLKQSEEWSPRKLTLGQRFSKDLRVNWQLYVMVVIPVIYYLIFTAEKIFLTG